MENVQVTVGNVGSQDVRDAFRALWWSYGGRLFLVSEVLWWS